MNKKNKILVGCLALLLALSVGYALFSDSITINGTATAKGSFDITPSCETGIASILGTAESIGLPAEGGYDKSECLVNDDEVTMSANFTMPGGVRYFTLKYTNTGSIDGIMNLADNTYTRQICVADNLAGDNEECFNKNVLKGYVAYNTSIFNSIGLAGIIVEDDKGNVLSSEEASKFVDSANGTFWLKPGYSGYVIKKMSINHNNTNTYPSNEMNVSFTNTFTNTFNQKIN